MQQVRFISSFLYWLSRILAIPYLLTAAYIVLAAIAGGKLLQPIDNGRRFRINFPFTEQPFLLGDSPSFWYLFEMIAFIGLYGIFFWLLGNVFRLFRQEKLFTEKGVKTLRIFYLLNLLVPLPFLIAHIVLRYEVETLVILTVLHAVVGVFAYFMAVIFSRGLQLQTEQDLIF